MAIGTTAAILGSAAIGAGASVASGRSQSRAVDSASRAQTQAAQQADQTNRYIFDRQTQLAEPFRQFGIQQANALGEIFGFNPVGQDRAASAAVPGAAGNNAALQAYLQNNPDVAREASRQAGFGFRADGVPANYDANGNGRVDPTEYAQLHFERFGQAEGRPMPNADGSYTASMNGAMQAEGMSNPGGAVSGPVATTGGGVNTQAQDRAQERFDGSLFNTALQGQLGRAATGIDANMAAQGNVYSGAREQAQQNAAADLGLGAVNMYLSGVLGQPSTAGAQMASNAAGQYGANSANLALQQGQNAANSAYQQGQINSQMYGNLANLGSFGLGAFTGGGSKPGKPASFFG